MRQPTKEEVNAILQQLEPAPRSELLKPTLIEMVEWDTRRLPPLGSMEFTPAEKSRLAAYMHQATRFRRSSWWRRWVR